MTHAREVLRDWQYSSVPVVDGGGALRGRLRAQDAEGDGAVSDRLTPVEATVNIDETLDDALARTLLSDDGWIAVIDASRYLGTVDPATIHRALRASVDSALKQSST
jgi:hypothetical protein